MVISYAPVWNAEEGKVVLIQMERLGAPMVRFRQVVTIVGQVGTPLGMVASLFRFWGMAFGYL